MHCAAPTVCLLWCVWGVDFRSFIVESRWHCRVAIPMSHVVVNVSYCVWYCHTDPVIVIVIVVICD